MEEKTADELFKELGYKKIITDLEIKYRNNINIGEIRFWKPTKAVMKHDEDGRYLSIKMQELQAINKKCQELRWVK